MDIPHFNRKPLIIVLSIFSGLLLIHLLGIYIYEWWKYLGLPGGSISIGVVGKTPDVMNPLTYGSSDSSDLMFRFMYRGLIRYNPEDETMQGDLATCDISNLSKVSCKLRNGIKWSDGTAVQNGDVVATINAFQKESQNQKMSKFLDSVTISAKSDGITISSKDKNPLMLELLTYPIIRSDMIEQVLTKRFSSGNYITSGMFAFWEIVTDSEYGFDRITLINNANYGEQPAWLDKIHFKFFSDLWSLERSTETLSVIIPPPKNENLMLSARFEKYPYTTYDYFWIFFHTDNMQKALRNALHWQIGTSFSGNIAANHKPIQTIFSSDEPILPTGNLGNLSDILRKMGYRKKDEIIASIDAQPTTVTGGVEYERPRFFKNKSNSLILFASDITDGILLTGVVPANTETVSINGYSLREFRSGNGTFAYRVSPENLTLSGGKHTYTVLFGPGDFTWETLTIYYSENSWALDDYRKEVDAPYLAKLNTPALLAERERKKEEHKKRIETLDNQYYYNEKDEPFRVKVAYITGQSSTEEYAQSIAATLKTLSLVAELIPVEAKELENIIKSGEKNYDIIVAWVSTSGNIAEIGQLFASNEAGKWVNFSNIESKNLDDLFIELRSSTLTGSIRETEKKITTIMQEESFFFPLSRPIRTFYVDRNLKWVKSLELIPGIPSLYSIFQYSSIKDTFILSTEGKGVFWFLRWIYSKAFH